MSNVSIEIREAINQIKDCKGRFGVLDGNEISNMLETPINMLNNVYNEVSDLKINNCNTINNIIYLMGRYMRAKGYITTLSSEYGSDEFMKDIHGIENRELSEIMEHLICMLKYNKEV